MARKVYYCVAVDLDNGDVTIDYATTEARFDSRGESVWVEDEDGFAGEWRSFANADEERTATAIITKALS
jgi:hypothetical protein